MEGKESTFDLVFGIGFKIGFLIVLIGLIMFYMPYLQSVTNLALDYMDFWETFRLLPSWMQVAIVGLTFMGVAVMVGAGRELVENLVNLLFWKDKDDF